MKVSTAKILECAVTEFLLNENTTRRVLQRQFIAHFGCKPFLAARIWNKIDKTIDYQLNFNNLIWFLATLHFMKSYPTTDVLAGRLGKDEKTVRKHLWKWTEYIGSVDLVSHAFEHSLYWNHFTALSCLVNDTMEDFSSDIYVTRSVWNDDENGEYVTDE